MRMNVSQIFFIIFWSLKLIKKKTILEKKIHEYLLEIKMSWDPNKLGSGFFCEKGRYSQVIQRGEGAKEIWLVMVCGADFWGLVYQVILNNNWALGWESGKCWQMVVG